MRIFRLVFCCVVLAGCSSGTVASPPLPANLPNGGALALGAAQRSGSSFALQPPAGTYKSLYSFKGPPDGSLPAAGLIAVNGTLYGTTVYGGASFPNGAIFKVSTSGTESALHSFRSGTDGSEPVAGLIDVNGALYGTTEYGGQYGYYGTVFKVSTSGTESVLHSFGVGTDGADPKAGLIAVNGALYGTTVTGGASGLGTVFKVSTSGTESVLYSFKGGTDGEYPLAGLIDVSGALYGTTFQGGANNYGTVFEVSTSGTESVLHSFGSGTDGRNPQAGLIDVNGALYGTTQGGGASGFGTVFKISTAGAESVLHSFGSGTDGRGPTGLINVNGALYGTTGGGGASGFGTVFRD